ncbi:dTDP-4-dehydrorhamnose 3,5-epimerase [Oryzibacter oryziterrae]|uniref:dTDP-4-dehydrorhamnose 3,5-epimerase n=1 Tax=Oryzibacter oryziterrae TaxID=2766474 RepID=UPI001F00174A|nr:dTDP-4-dehydrorhamnose 3,5-epimerase [Oryzibacter oryziterrae]
MEIERTAIADVLLMRPKKFGDARGYFMETFRADQLAEWIGPQAFVQDNQSMSAEQGTVRGLHFQLEPRAQGKLVRCVAGALFDVAVDLRRGSPTFGRHVGVELTEENALQLWVPAGFAHGFCTLVDRTVIAYKVSDYYSPEHDRGLRWDDPALGIDWPVEPDKAVLSVKDKMQPALADLASNFVYRP